MPSHRHSAGSLDPGPEPRPADSAAPISAENSAPSSVDSGVRAIRARGFAVGLATGLYGISFGALATAAGLSVAQTMVLSLVMYTGGSQFAFVGVISGGGSAIGAAAASVLLGIRNTLYGLTLSRIVPASGGRTLARAHLTIDESAATAHSGSTPEQQQAGFWAAGLWVFVFWNVFSLVGAFLGRYADDPGAWGLDAAAAAAFLGLLWPRLRAAEPIAVAVAAAFVALLTTPALPAGLPVLAAALVAVLTGVLAPRDRHRDLESPRQHSPESVSEDPR